MMLKEVITDQLEWTIPLTVDIQYGGSWRVEKDFFTDFPHLKERLNEPLREFVPAKKVPSSVAERKRTEEAVETVKQGVPAPQPVEEVSQDVVSGVERDVVLQETVSSETQPVENGPQDVVVPLSKGLDGNFIYELKDRRPVTLRWLNDIINYLLKEATNISEEKRQILRIKDKRTRHTTRRASTAEHASCLL